MAPRTYSLPRPPEALVPCSPKSRTIAHSAGPLRADDLAPLIGARTPRFDHAAAECQPAASEKMMSVAWGSALLRRHHRRSGYAATHAAERVKSEKGLKKRNLQNKTTAGGRRAALGISMQLQF